MAETIEVTLILNNRYGLHARPAALFVQTCNRFASDVQVTSNGLTVNGKNILGIMTLGAAAGSEITLTVSGYDAAQAIAALQDLINNNFGEK